MNSLGSRKHPPSRTSEAVIVGAVDEVRAFKFVTVASVVDGTLDRYAGRDVVRFARRCRIAV
jgi:hypothetical protein